MMMRKSLLSSAKTALRVNALLFAGSGTTAAADTAAAPRTITVTGEGEVKSAPDEAHLSAGVVTQAKKAADALAANTRAMNAVFATLERLGIPDRAIQTS